MGASGGLHRLESGLVRLAGRGTQVPYLSGARERLLDQ
jgi:hypothetical protein